jgi:hypothetical protein
MGKDYKNKTVYIRESHNEENPYTTISNLLVKDERLTASEKGLMLMILSNANYYVFNSSFLQKESGLGKVQFNKCMKRLQELGYLLKKPLKNGGYKWIVMESTIIFNDLQKIGYLFYNSESSSWLIKEELESTLQLSDFHRKPENKNPNNQKPKYENPINQNTEFRNPDTQPIINTNNPSNIGMINNKENPKEKRTNETAEGKVQILDSFSEVEIEKVNLKSLSKTPIQNSLPTLFEHSESLRTIFKSVDLTLDELKDYSDGFIALLVLSIKLKEKDSQWEEINKGIEYNPKHYTGLLYACRNALTFEIETKLKRELIAQSKISLDDLHKCIFGY